MLELPSQLTDIFFITQLFHLVFSLSRSDYVLTYSISLTVIFKHATSERLCCPIHFSIRPFFTFFFSSFHLFSNPLDHLLLLIRAQTGRLSSGLLSTEGSCPAITRCSPCPAFLSSLIQSCHESSVKTHISS